MATVEELHKRFTRSVDDLTAAQLTLEKSRSRSESATVGGLTGYDSAVLSGIRRKRNTKSDERRWSAYDREADASQHVADLTSKVASYERAWRHAVKERDRVPFTRDELTGAFAVRDQFGWHKVRKVNTKTVSVDSGYSWADLIPLDKILDYRK